MTAWDIFIKALGIGSAILTSTSYIPQVSKALPRHSTADLSLKTLVALTAGLSGWIVYGVAIADPIIVIANLIGAGLSGTVLACKLRDSHSGEG